MTPLFFLCVTLLRPMWAIITIDFWLQVCDYRLSLKKGDQLFDNWRIE